MPQFDIATVQHVATLARLKMSDEDAALYALQFSIILSYFDQLAEVDTKDIPPTAHPIPLTNVLREDSPAASWSQQKAFTNAPLHQQGYFRVPKVLDQNNEQA